MIKVCHLTTAHPWNDVRIFEKECKSLSANGFEVYLIAFEAKNEDVDGVHIVNAGKRPPGRLKRMFYGPKIIYKSAININADIYHFHDPELMAVGIKLSKSGKKVVYDVHEDVPRQILDKPYLNPLLAKIISYAFEKYEKKAIKHFHGLLCATPYIKSCFENVHKNVLDVNNFPLLSEIVTDNTTAIKQDKICYIGGLSEIRGIVQLVNAMELCSNLKLDLAGAFENDVLKHKTQALKGWKNVNELGFISRKESIRIKKESKAGIITFLPAANHINAQPNKLFEYMSAGLPVICSHFPLWKDIVEGNKCGICVNPENPKEIAQAIHFILEHQEEARIMGINGRNAVNQQYNWSSEEKKLVNFYNQLL